MDKSSNQAESLKLARIRKAILDMDMPQESYSKQIMNKIGVNEMVQKKNKFMKKTLVAAAAVAIMGGGVIGSGFVSPAMADTLKHLPVVGSVFDKLPDKSLNEAVKKGLTTAPDLTITHDGVTLKVKEVLFDGSRLSVALERQGVEGIGLVSGEQNPKEKGYLGLPDLKVNGETKRLFGAFGEVPNFDNVVMFDAVKDVASLPDSFELTFETKVSGVAEPFTFKIPVKKLAVQKALKPEASISGSGYSYTVKELTLSPASTRLVIDGEGVVPASAEQTGKYAPSQLRYEIVDDQGNVLQSSLQGVKIAGTDTKHHDELVFSAVKEGAKSITIKPYTETMVKDAGFNKELGLPKEDGKKTYLKDLELTVPLQ
ncbi:Tat pathway signal protein [Paenibacillus sp. CAA11]|uniref:DUF4179 domain-containing protein n=1 Tax=Paenibacillus sp. CAA11 TaxID=1532905 RepID=UPI000D3928EB|nr:DUF4179 domain-containing protein [Paenibacillus sp. CAA11]AWB43725.1 Tat pathway signal protein [Paenibacillus sp. CAA11]